MSNIEQGMTNDEVNSHKIIITRR